LQPLAKTGSLTYLRYFRISGTKPLAPTSLEMLARNGFVGQLHGRIRVMSDIVFDASEQVTVLCNNLNVTGHDFLLDSAVRRKANGPQFRRALVHDQSDGLTVNYSGDYPGGVTINGLLNLTGDIEFRITHRDSILETGQHPPTETVMLAEVIKSLRGEIAQLRARVESLERKA
jgi:hypothetical protein